MLLLCEYAFSACAGVDTWSTDQDELGAAGKEEVFVCALVYCLPLILTCTWPLQVALF